LRNSKTLIIAILVVAVLSLMIYTATQSQFVRFEPPLNMPNLGMTEVKMPTANRPANCVPLPTDMPAKINLPRTVTPTFGPLVAKTKTENLSPYPSISSTPLISYTSTPYPNLIDLSPNLPRSKKSSIIVYRCDGTYVEFLVGPEIKIPNDLNLNPGDIIWKTFENIGEGWIPPILTEEIPDTATPNIPIQSNTQAPPLTISTAYPAPSLSADELNKGI